MIIQIVSYGYLKPFDTYPIKITCMSFFNSWDHPGTSYYLSEYAVNIENSTKMAELHFDSTPPPSLYKLKFSLGQTNKRTFSF